MTLNWTSPEMAGALELVTFESGGKRLIGRMLVADTWPQGTVLLLHGLPGTELNLDLAHSVRRFGWNVFVFHYRGSWGSQGDFSIAHSLEDVARAIAFLRQPVSQDGGAEKLVAIGHSLGGSLALMAQAFGFDISAAGALAAVDLGILGRELRDQPKQRMAMQAMFEAEIAPLQGTSAKELVDEIARCADAWDLVPQAEDLARHPVLMVAGTEDSVTPPRKHYEPLLCALLAHERAQIHGRLLSANHGFLQRRDELASEVTQWLATL